MALASTNPIRLSDAHLMCTGEFLITPYETTQNGQTLKPLSWLTHLPSRLNSINSAVPETELATSLVIASTPAGLRTGLILRMRMLPEGATPAQCQEALSLRLGDYERIIAGEGLAPVRPLAAEGVYALLPRDGLRFLCRARNEKGRPLRNDSMTPVTCSLLEALIARHPGSGLCITLLPDSITKEPGKLDFLIASWGLPESTPGVSAIPGIPLEPFRELSPEDPLAGFQFLYDPWALRFRISKPTWGEELVSTSTAELIALLGLYSPPAPAAPPPAAPTPRSMAASARRMAGSLTQSLPGIRQQMHASVQALRRDTQAQVAQTIDGALQDVQQHLSRPLQQSAMSACPAGAAIPLPQLAAQARAAGLDLPIDPVTLMKMGFCSERALMDAGLTPDQLCLLRAALQQRRQCPDGPGDVNCRPCAAMLGHLLDALLPAGAAGSTCPRGDNADQAAWLTLCKALHSLLHPTEPGSFLSSSALSVAFDAFLLPGASRKRTLVQLPAFCDAPYASAALHIARHASAFRPSLLQQLLGGHITSGEENVC